MKKQLTLSIIAALVLASGTHVDAMKRKRSHTPDESVPPIGSPCGQRASKRVKLSAPTGRKQLIKVLKRIPNKMPNSVLPLAALNELYLTNQEKLESHPEFAQEFHFLVIRLQQGDDDTAIIEKRDRVLELLQRDESIALVDSYVAAQWLQAAPKRSRRRRLQTRYSIPGPTSAPTTENPVANPPPTPAQVAAFAARQRQARATQRAPQQTAQPVASLTTKQALLNYLEKTTNPLYLGYREILGFSNAVAPKNPQLAAILDLILKTFYNPVDLNKRQNLRNRAIKMLNKRR